MDKERQNVPRGYNMGELQALDLAIWGVGKAIFFQHLIFKILGHGVVALSHMSPTSRWKPQSEFGWRNVEQNTKPSTSLTSISTGSPAHTVRPYWVPSGPFRQTEQHLWTPDRHIRPQAPSVRKTDLQRLYKEGRRQGEEHYFIHALGAEKCCSAAAISAAAASITISINT
jgi:hypothetical protein